MLTSIKNYEDLIKANKRLIKLSRVVDILNWYIVF